MSMFKIDPWVESRILSFLNQAQSIEEFERITDDPSEGKGGAIGPREAQAILDHRESIPGHQFRNLSQVFEVDGVGAGKIQDMAVTFGVSASEAFSNRMKKEVLPENWKLQAHTIHLDNQAQFFQVAHHPGTLSTWVAEEVEQLVLARSNNRSAAQLAGELLSRSYPDTYDNSHYASLAFASWFYRFDADQWFKLEQAWTACERYLEYFNQWPDRLEFYLFKGFPNSGILVDGICPPDLPVVVNFAEQNITIWTAELFD